MKIKYILVTALLVVALAALTILTPTQRQSQEIASTTSQSTVVSVYIDTEYEFIEVHVPTGSSILDALTLLEASNVTIQLTTKEYSGLGTLVTGLYGKINGEGDNYWQYTVNDIAPPLGADAYVLKNGDRVEWRFAKSEF